MKYRILVLDCNVAKLTASKKDRAECKEIMEKTLEGIPVNERHFEEMVYDVDLDVILDTFLEVYTCCECEFVDDVLPVAVFLDDKFVGYYLLYQTVYNCNTHIN